ncbi:MAG: hypothetical protein VYC19_08285 [Pseudomonadota bacterium]|nr:hypothetical protein [Pseudomonadota bacterium]MEE3322586.1 hypothetical protein [Pseudomonadota bacterium]
MQNENSSNDKKTGPMVKKKDYAAEMTLYNIGDNTQVLISDNAVFDMEMGEMPRNRLVKKYIDQSFSGEAQAFTLLHDYVRLTCIGEDGSINPIFLNVNNIEVVATIGEGRRQSTTVHMNYADVTYDVVENAEQICWAGDGYVNDFDEELGEDAPTRKSTPRIYQYPLPDIDVAFDDVKGMRKVQFDNVAAIEHHFNWAAQRLTILPYPISARSEYKEGELYVGHAELKTTRAKKPSNPSYIYPLNVK